MTQEELNRRDCRISVRTFGGEAWALADGLQSGRRPYLSAWVGLTQAERVFSYL